MTRNRHHAPQVDTVASALLSEDGTYGVSMRYPARVPEPTGYVVGRAGHGLVLRGMARDEARAHALVSEWLLRHWGHTAYVGSWVDSDTGVLYLDCVTICGDLSTAMAAARNYGEIAVWDMANNSEIRVA